MPTERKVLAVSAAVVVVSASALTALAGGTAHAQFAPPSTARAPSAPSKPINLQVDVQPTAVFGAGNVTRVSYVVANTPRSTDRLSEFAVRSPVPVWRLEVPAPKARYLGVTREGRDDVAGWGWVDDMPRPGESSPVLAYEAIGLPGVVPYRALRYGGYDGSGGVRPTAQTGESGESGGDGGGGPRELRFHRAGAEYVVGKTVGVVPLPLDVRPAALANRLRRLVDESCELGWITSMTVCRSLRADARPSARALRAFHGELVAHRGKAVGEAAFALLAPNAEFLLTKM